MVPMDVGLKGVKPPRKLVIESPYSGMIVSQILGAPILHEGNRRQLVHRMPVVEKASRLVRFAAHLGLAKGNKSMMDAVKSAYSFVSGNYQSGDHVMFEASYQWEYDLANVVLASLYVDSYSVDSELDFKAAETLAKHLHDGTRPGDRPKSQPSSRNNESPGKIPIHGIVVWVSGETRQMCEVNDEIKSRFPPGIEHIISYTYDGGSRSYATRFDMTGGIVSREICFFPSGPHSSWTYCTKHIVYWDEDQIPEWYQDDPVWTQELYSPPGGGPDGLGLGLTKPVGMYRYELRKYHRCFLGKDEFMLVWKSYRGAD